MAAPIRVALRVCDGELCDNKFIEVLPSDTVEVRACSESSHNVLHCVTRRVALCTGVPDPGLVTRGDSPRGASAIPALCVGGEVGIVDQFPALQRPAGGTV
jgi:hypothetical protein